MIGYCRLCGLMISGPLTVQPTDHQELKATQVFMMGADAFKHLTTAHPEQARAVGMWAGRVVQLLALVHLRGLPLFDECVSAYQACESKYLADIQFSELNRRLELKPLPVVTHDEKTDGAITD